MPRRSPGDRLRVAADCLSRLRALGPDLITTLYQSHNQRRFTLSRLSGDGSGPVIESRRGGIGGEFQTRTETDYPGGGAYLMFVLNSSAAPAEGEFIS
jgi:hypothetical protein